MSSVPVATSAVTKPVSGDSERMVTWNPQSRAGTDKKLARRMGFGALAASVIDALAQAEFEPLRTTLNWRA